MSTAAEAFYAKVQEYLDQGVAKTVYEAGQLVASTYPALYSDYRRNPEIYVPPVVKTHVPIIKTYAERSLDELVEKIEKQHPQLTRAQAQDKAMETEDGKRLWEMRRDQLRPQ